MEPIIAVIIVAWNGYDNTQECIESVINQQLVNTNIFLVDNGSKVEPLRNLTLSYPRINYIFSEKNLGFAAGYNLGLRTAMVTKADYYLIINNDTRADSLMLHELITSISDESVGLVAPVIYYYDAPGQVWSSGGFMNKVLMMPLDSHSQNTPIVSPTERTFLSGCCYLIKRNLLEQVGLFDERFFLYFEDLDYCRRVNETEWKMEVVPSAKLYHKVSQSSGGQFSENERFYYAMSSGTYFRKHWNYGNAIPIIIFRLGSAVVTTVKLLSQGKFCVLKCYLKGLFKGWFEV